MPSRHVHWADDLTARNTARNRRPDQNCLTLDNVAEVPDVRAFNANTWAWTAAPSDRQLGSDGRMHDMPSVSEAMTRERERMRRDRERDLGRLSEINEVVRERDLGRLSENNEVVREGQEEEWARESEWRRERREREGEDREWMWRRVWRRYW